MADQKISELTNITGANLANADEFVVVDSSADQTKAITFGELKEAFDTGTGFVRITGDTMTGDLTVPIVTISNEIRLEGDTGPNALIQKNASTGRDELQIYADGDAYQAGSRGAGIHLYGNSDNEHDGNFAVLTGPDDNGDARIIAAGREDKTHVTIGNAILDYVDDGDDHALLNLKGADAQPALLIEGAGSTEGDIVTVTGEAMQFGHWDKATTTFTERMRINSSGSVGIGTSSPSTALDVTGTITSDGLTVDAATPILRLDSPAAAWSGGEDLGGIDWYTKDTSGSGPAVMARIYSESSGSNTLPIPNMVFQTSLADVALKDRMKIAGTGDISFYDDTGTTPKFFWDASAESLGVGTAAPADKLHVEGNIYLGASNRTVYTGGAGNLTFQTNTGEMAFARSNGSSESMRIDSSGNVGIGTASPTSTLDLRGTLRIDGGGNSYIYSDASGLNVETSGARFTRFLTNGSEAMRIDSGGKVGIGTSSPDGNSNVQIQNDTGNALLRLRSSTTGLSGVDFGDSGDIDIGGIRYNNSSNYMYFNTNASEAMRIDSSGNVGIGTDSPASLVSGGSSPVLTIGGTDSILVTGEKAGALSFITNDSSYSNTFPDGITGEIVSVCESAFGSAYGLAFYTGIITDSNRGERVRIDRLGRVGIGTTSPTEQLEVHSTGDATVLVKTSGTGDADATLQLDSAASGESVVEFLHDGVSGAKIEWFTDGSPDLNITTNAGTNGVIDFQPNNSLAMRIDASGNMLLGTTTVGYTNEAVVLRERGEAYITSDGRAPLLVNRLTSDGVLVSLRKDGSTVGSIGATTNSYNYFAGPNTGIFCYNAGVGPTSGSGVLSDNAKDLGAIANRWDDIYATNGTIQTSDRNEKQDIEALSDAETRVAQACKGLLRKFRWQDAVAEKGDDARIHFGIIAQDLQDAFTAEGLDAGRYAMFISSTWWETQTEVPAVEAVAEVLDDEGNVVTEAVEAKEAYTRTDTYETQEEAPEGATERTRLGVRYPELLSFIIAAI